MISLRKSLVLLLLAAAIPAWAQGPEVGRLLVASPTLDDPDVAESVLLILLHENGSSAAIFLNRPTWVEPTEAYPDVDGLESYTDPLFRGGPVAPEQMLILFEYDGAPPVGARQLFGNVYFSPSVDFFSTIDLRSETAPRVRVYAGHAQWGPGQLAAEIVAGIWRVIEGQARAVFDAEPDRKSVV